MEEYLKTLILSELVSNGIEGANVKIETKDDETDPNIWNYRRTRTFITIEYKDVTYCNYVYTYNLLCEFRGSNFDIDQIVNNFIAKLKDTALQKFLEK